MTLISFIIAYFYGSYLIFIVFVYVIVAGNGEVVMACIELVQKADGVVTMQSHLHDSEQMLYVRSGNVEVQIDQHLFQITEPSIIFISRLEKHTFISRSADYSRYYVNIKASEAALEVKDSNRLLAPFINRPAGHHHVIPVGEIVPVLDTLFELLYQEFRLDGTNAQPAFLQVILQVLYRNRPDVFPCESTPLNHIIQSIQQRFEANPADTISLAELAAENHFSVSYLTHRFKEITGYSIGRYRMLCRIAAAKQMLLTTNRPISEVSSACGFPDLSNFCRYFRDEVGSSPSAFRNESKSE